MTTARIYIDEWRFGDERWAFEIGAQLRIVCDALDPQQRSQLLETWDDETLRDTRYIVDDGPEEDAHQLDGVITAIRALYCRYPSPTGGQPIPHSGSAQPVRVARGWTGNVDHSKAVILAFLIDLELDS